MKRILFLKVFLAMVFSFVSITANALLHNYGCRGNLTIYVGEEITVSHPFPNYPYISDDGWYLYARTGASYVRGKEEGGAKIVSSNGSNCTIKGMWDNSGAELSSLQLYCYGTLQSKNEEYECYWNVTVKSHGSLIVDASPTGGTVNIGTKVTLTAKNNGNTVSGCDIYYTLDGSVPTTSSTKYTSSGVIINNSCWLKAKAYKTGYESLSTGEWYYTAKDPGILVTNISLDATSVSLKVGKTKQLTATITPDDATDKTVTWTSSNPSVATVSNTGLVTALTEGRATITCKANDISGKSASCSINVSDGYKDNEVFTATVPSSTGSVDMRFKVISASDKTCRIYAWGYNPAINSECTGDITIPTEVEGMKVVKIDYYAFYYCKGITSITIPASVESIGSYAFQGCTNLESVALGGSVKSLDYYAFSGCTSLTSITGFRKLEYIGQYAFNDTPWYNSLPDGLVYLGKVLYKYKGTMPDNTTVNVNEGVKMIAYGAFSSCKGLVGISIPQSVETIGSYVFNGCSGLTSINVAAENVKFDSRDNCNAIIDKEKNILVAGCKNSTFPATVTAIGRVAFIGSGLTEIVIPNNIDSIASYAFSYCSELKTVDIGKGLRVMGENPFLECTALRSITVASDNPYFDSRDNCNAIIEKSTNKLIVGCTTTVIPQTVKAIGDDAFRTSDYDTYSITLPDQVETIGQSAFYGTDNLVMLTIGNGVKEIGGSAFNYCNKLRAIHVRSQEPIDIPESVFSSTNYNNAILYVPLGARINYMDTPCWNKFKNIVETDGLTPCEGDILESAGSPLVFAITSQTDRECEVTDLKSMAEGSISIPSQIDGYSVKGIGERAFYYKKGVSHIDMPVSLTYLNDYALYHCSDLESVELPSSLERIGYFTLGGLGKINSIVIPKTVKDIDRGILTGDTLLASVIVESGNPIYDSRGGCNAIIKTATNTLVAGIQTTVIPQDIKTIGECAFNGQVKMEATSIPNSVTCIDEFAYNNCGLKSITIPANVDSIGSRAFRYCRNLNEVISLIENPSAINENVFYSDHDGYGWQFTSATLYVPRGCKSKYENTEGWNKFEKIVEIETPSPIITGDANGDGVVDVADVVSIVNYILEKPADNFNIKAADVNGDEVIDAADVVGVVNIILDKGNVNAARVREVLKENGFIF